MNDEIMVSVICLCYNHEKFIEKTIQGFISQKTNFKFEVFIHDDASTDKSAKIIKKYESQYPEIIHAIIQSKNQFSQGISITSKFILPKIKGKYIALCEGDDYWIDELKLQKQFDVLEGHPECNGCVHKVEEINVDNHVTGYMYPNFDFQSGIIHSKEFLTLTSSYCFHTSSYFFKACYYKDLLQDPPEFKKLCQVGDEVYMLYFGQLGDMYYINETMSRYRRGVPGSWSQTQYGEKFIEKTIIHNKAMIETLKSFDSYTHNLYHDICVRRIAPLLASYGVVALKCNDILKKENKEYYKILSRKRKLFIILGSCFPKTMRKIYLKRIQALTGRYR